MGYEIFLRSQRNDDKKLNILQNDLQPFTDLGGFDHFDNCITICSRWFIKWHRLFQQVCKTHILLSGP